MMMMMMIRNYYGGKGEAGGSGMVVEENHQVVNTNTTMNYNSNIIIRKRKVSEDSTLSTQEKASKSKRKKERDQAQDEANMDDGTDMHTTNANDINAHAAAAGHEDHDGIDFQTDHHNHHNGNDQYNQHHHQHQHHMDGDRSQQSESNDHHCIDEKSETIYSPTHETQIFDQFALPSQVAENQILRQSCAQARIVINDVISPVQVATGEEKVAADLNNDMTMNTKTNSHHEKWNRFFMELVEYKETNGHCNIPRRNGTLGGWIMNQRSLFKSKKLKADRHEKLVGIGFTFVYESNLWNTQFMELMKYKEKNGHCNIPTTNASLGKWISTQRTLFTSMKLNVDRYEKLVGIGFVFEDARFAMDNVKWNTRFVELVEYNEKNGHCNIPTKNGSFGGWIKHQRKLFKSKKLKADRYEKLVGIGFTFEDVTELEFKKKLDQQWQEMYQKLLEHKEMKGHCFDLPSILPLGRWLRKQRWLYKHGNLREDRAKKLLSIGFDDKKGLKKGGAGSVRDATSGQPSRKKRKVLDLDNDFAAITHDEGEKGIDDIKNNGDVNDYVNAHEEVYFQRCDDGSGRLEMHNDLEMDLVRPLDGDNDQNVSSAFTDDDLLGNNIALAMILLPLPMTRERKVLIIPLIMVMLMTM
jgi:hypothetical protein